MSLITMTTKKPCYYVLQIFDYITFIDYVVHNNLMTDNDINIIIDFLIRPPMKLKDAFKFMHPDDPRKTLKDLYPNDHRYDSTPLPKLSWNPKHNPHSYTMLQYVCNREQLDNLSSIDVDNEYYVFEELSPEYESIDFTPNIKDTRIPNNIMFNSNPRAIKILEKHYLHLLDKRDNLWCLSGNKSAIHIIEENLHKLKNEDPDNHGWFHLSQNPNAISILEKNFNDICWNGVSRNVNAYSLFDKIPIVNELGLIDKNWYRKLNWYFVCQNQSAIPFIEKHFILFMINYNIPSIYWLPFNPGIFEIDFAEKHKILRNLHCELNLVKLSVPTQKHKMACPSGPYQTAMKWILSLIEIIIKN